MKLVVTFFGLALSASACAVPAAEPADLDSSAASDEDKSRWSAGDNPDALIGRALDRRADRLPREGKVQNAVWPSSYWPTYNNSINYRWAGASIASPAEKYERAFGVRGFSGNITANHGLAQATRTGACGGNRTCANEAEDVCVSNAGQSFCTPAWTGSCHGWAPASFLVPEPRHAVVRNGVRFEVNDIKALATILYTDVGQTMISTRCDETLGAGSPRSEACRNTNAGTFHVAVSNLVGIGKKSFVVDRTIDAQVWNHPIYDYRVTRFDTIDLGTAAQLATGRRANTYSPNTAAKAFRRVQMQVSMVVESEPEVDGPLMPTIADYLVRETYDYVLELDAQGLVIGGEWIGESVRNHPDFLWAPNGQVPNVTADGLRATDVHNLIRDSQ